MVYEHDIYHTIGAVYQESLRTDLIKGHRGLCYSWPSHPTTWGQTNPAYHTQQEEIILKILLQSIFTELLYAKQWAEI